MMPVINGIQRIFLDHKEIMNARKKILKKIKENIKIKFPNSIEDLILQTESSDLECSGIFIWSHGLLGIFSHKFNETEKRYKTM